MARKDYKPGQSPDDIWEEYNSWDAILSNPGILIILLFLALGIAFTIGLHNEVEKDNPKHIWYMNETNY